MPAINGKYAKCSKCANDLGKMQQYACHDIKKEQVKKRQQRVLLILDSKNVKYEVIDIAEPGSEEQKDFMQNNSKSFGGTIGDPNPRHPLPPQIFNDDVYCGDYDGFDMANEVDEMDKFLKLEPTEITSTADLKIKNGEIKPKGEPELKNGDHKAEEDAKEEKTEDETNKGEGDNAVEAENKTEENIVKKDENEADGNEESKDEEKKADENNEKDVTESNEKQEAENGTDKS